MTMFAFFVSFSFLLKIFRSGRTLQFYLANNNNVNHRYVDTANVKIMSIKQ